MAYHSFVVASMLIAGSTILTDAAPLSLTLDYCGVTRPCGANDTFQVLCPSSTTCNEYYQCNNGIASIRTCKKAFYFFWLTPIYNPAKNCCQLIVRFYSPVRPIHGLCPTPVDTSPKDDTENNVQVKRHAEGPSPVDLQEVKFNTTTQQLVTSPEPPKASEPSPAHLMESPPTGQAAKTKTTEGSKSDGETKEESASSAIVPSSPFLAIVIFIFFNLWVRH